MTSSIFDIGAPGRSASAQSPTPVDVPDLPAKALRRTPPRLPEVSELQTVRHYTNLSRRNFSIDGQFYPLGSCTMKYNPRGAHRIASLAGFAGRHPLAEDCASQGFLACLHELQEVLKEATGMAAVSASPMAGAQGEFAGIAMIRAYHDAHGDSKRREIIVPDAAHGTNPASAVMCGYTAREVPVGADGDVDFEALKAAVGEQTAGIMLTNPSTCGVFERRIAEIADLVHEAGGLLYYDGANLNAILGKARPGDMGFDVLHVNLHKTFATPHGGGGPGSGPVGANERLAPYLPTPMAVRNGDSFRGTHPAKRDAASPAHAPAALEASPAEGSYHWLEPADAPDSIGRLSAFAGNAGILLRALAYARMLGQQGMQRVGEFATLNANYLMERLRQEGFELAYEGRRASHEFVITFRSEAKGQDVSAMDIAKRLLDHGIHAPTTYFPLLVPECFLIEPTETETKKELDAFVEALVEVRNEAHTDPDRVKTAPHDLPSARLDDVKAARDLRLVHEPD